MTEWVAYTPIEGPWPFTRSATREEAVEKLLQMIRWRKVLCVPLPENAISAVLYEPAESSQ